MQPDAVSRRLGGLLRSYHHPQDPGGNAAHRSVHCYGIRALGTNMFMIPLGVLVSDTAGADFWIDAGIQASSDSGLTWDRLLVDNLLPVTLANIVGGGVMMGVMYWTISHHIERPAQPPT